MIFYVNEIGSYVVLHYYPTYPETYETGFIIFTSINSDFEKVD